MRADRFELITLSLAGVVHHAFGVKAAAKRRPDSEIPYGGELVLTREPQNEYDKCAVMVSNGADNIGHIPRIHAVWLSKMLDNGYKLSAHTEAVDMRNHTVIVTVTMAKPAEEAST